MRPIKFRCWVKMSKSMQDWDSLLEKRDRLKRLILAHNSEHDYILMQFTGLLDKNGKEIFEGDYVKAHFFYFNGNHDADGEFKGKIVYDTNLCAFVIEKNEEEIMLIQHTSHHEEPCIEIIGNIYENEELLK